ncbi:MAG: hypothetical protein OXF96_07715 [Chloroflexi bacterium]|nr:hypothetical protein [Chloroflexota bacterium]
MREDLVQSVRHGRIGLDGGARTRRTVRAATDAGTARAGYHTSGHDGILGAYHYEIDNKLVVSYIKI